MNTIHTRATRLLITAIGAAVMGISLAAAPAALADENPPSGPGNFIPLPPGAQQPGPPPQHPVLWHPSRILPQNKVQQGWK